MSTPPTDLLRVVEINESAKAILWESQQVDLRSLDAVIRSSRAGPALRGFVEVSTQMRRWSGELRDGARQVFSASASQVLAVSSLVRLNRLAALLESAASQARADSDIANAGAAAREAARTAAVEVARLRRHTTSCLEDLQQLGLMANVLSRAALIEAACGNEKERRELSAVAAEFGQHAEEVLNVLRRLLSSHTAGSP